MSNFSTCVTLSVFAVLATGPAIAVTSPNFVYSAPKTGFYSISPTELQPVDAAAADNFSASSQEFSTPTPALVVCGAAALHLPENATIQSVAVRYFDGPDQDVTISVYRTELSTLSVNLLVLRSFVDDASQDKTVSTTSDPAFSIVKNASYTYTATACVGNGSVVRWLRVKYTYTNAGD